MQKIPISVTSSSNPSFARAALACFVAALMLLPWLNPVASGPSPSVFPWIMAASACAVLWLVRSKLEDSTIASTWLLAAVLSACIGLLQYFGFAVHFKGWLHVTALGDAFANLRQRNQFATLMSAGLLALLWQASRLPLFRWHFGRNGLWWFVPSLILLALGNAASSSRTGMLQWCLILALSVLWARPQQWRIVWFSAVAVAIYAVSTLALPAALEFWTGTQSGGLLARFAEEPGCSSRRVLWSNVLHLIAQKPWLGWGWGELDFAHFVTLYPQERFCDILDNAHNLPLHLAVELGLPFAIVTMGLFVWWMLRNRPWAEQDPTRQMAWAVLAVIALHSLLEYPLWYGPFQLAVGLCVLLLWRTRQGRGGGGAGDKPPNALEKMVVLVYLMALFAAAWDYWRVSQLYKLPADRAVAYKDNSLDKVRGTWFFQDQVEFAELTTVQLDRSNAAQHYAQATRLLHFSPEPRVIEAVIESAVMLGKDDEALYYLRRYRAAFPVEHAAWAARSAGFKAP